MYNKFCQNFYGMRFEKVVQIAYLIGNGFDIHLGMQSKYQQFYSWLSEEIENPKNSKKEIFNIKNNELIQEFILHNNPWHFEESEKDEWSQDNDWSDFEASLLNNIRCLSKTQNANGKVKKQIRNLQQVNKLLKKYLKLQTENVEQRLDLDSCDIEVSLSNQFSRLPSEDFLLIRTLLNREFKNFPQKRQSGDIKFINFNYTFLLQKFISSKPFVTIKGLHDFLNFNSFSINSTIHYPNGNFIDTPELGIGTKEEIPENLTLNDNEINYLSKESFARIRRDNRVNEISAVIANSDITFLYGLSLGESDDFYISKVMESLLKNENHVAIITYFNENYSEGEFDMDIMDQISAVKIRLVQSYLHICQLKNISVEDDENSLLNAVSNRIIVLFDHGLRENEQTEKMNFFPFSSKAQNNSSDISLIVNEH